MIFISSHVIKPVFEVFRSSEVYSIQHYVKKFVTHLPQVDGFLRTLWFPPPIKLTATI